MQTLVSSLILLVTLQESTIDRASRSAETFWQEFTAVQCKERLSQTKLKPDGKVLETHSQEFDYVAFLKSTSRGLLVEESRVSRDGSGTEKNERLLVTSGFPTFLLLFHPEFRDRFELTEISATPGDTARRIAFKSKAGPDSMSALKLRDHVYPILWKGTATIDGKSGAIRRVEAALDVPMDDLGLSELQVELDYGPTVLAGASQTYWLPVRATITLKTLRQAWRNVHEFLDYKRFSVTTSTRGGESK